MKLLLILILCRVCAGYSPPNYTVSSVCEFVHKAPRVKGVSDFDPVNKDYWIGVATFPVVLGVIGVVFLVVYFAMKCCCNYGRPDSSRAIGRTFAFITAGLCIGSSVYGIQSNSSTYNAIQTITDSLKGFTNVFDKGSETTRELNSKFDGFSRELSNYSTTCTTFKQDIQNAASDFTQASATTEQVRSLVDPIKDGLNKGVSLFDNAMELRNTFQYVAFIGLIVLSGIVGVSIVILHCNSIVSLTSVCIKLCSCLGVFIASFFWAIITVGLVLSIVGSDFCMKPDENLTKYLPSSVNSYVKYYTLCHGTNELENMVHSSITTVNDTLQQLRVAIPAIEADCKDSKGEMNSIINSITTVIDTTGEECEALVGCEGINKLYIKGVHEGVCEQLIPRLVFLWLATFGAIVSLKCLLCQANCITTNQRRRAEFERLNQQPMGMGYGSLAKY